VKVGLYTHLVYVLPTGMAAICNWVGIAELPGAQTWFTADDQVSRGAQSAVRSTEAASLRTPSVTDLVVACWLRLIPAALFVTHVPMLASYVNT
jgi:hypothetical protein